jgi:CRP/FNR family cyclic AMP-dependent transcriptional regulator
VDERLTSAARSADQALPQPDSIQREAIQMSRVEKKPFDTAQFLATEGPGRCILRHTAKQDYFTQGSPADAVFFLQNGQAKLTVLSKRGKEATVTMLAAGDFFGEEAMVEVGALRTSTASAVTLCAALKIERNEMLRALHDEHEFSVFFMKFILNRGIRTQADLVDQLFNSSERRLARTLLLMADFGQPGEPVRLIPHVTQETLAEMIGTTRSRVSFFMNRFRKLGYIEYNGRIHVNTSLLNMVLLDQLPEENSSRPKLLDPRLSPAETARRAKLV